MTRYDYMKLSGLHGSVERPDDPVDEKFMDAVDRLASSFDYLYNEPMYEEAET